MPILREVTIGRDKGSDIYLDANCKFASNHHATMYYDGTQLMFRDNSTNGTLINNVSVKHRAVPIYHGDTIMIAGKYPISWNQIDAFFPNRPYIAPMPVVQQPTKVEESILPDTASWSWGAFFLYPIWGFFNGCWWAFLMSFLYLAILPNILFGVFGRRLAWQNAKWSSAADFNSTQSSWDAWGWGIFIVSLICTFIIIIGFAAAIS